MRDSLPFPIDNRYAVSPSMAYTLRKSSFSAPGTVPACQVSPPSVVRTNVPSVPLTQTTLRLTMLNPNRLASVFDFCACQSAKAGKTNNGRTINILFCIGICSLACSDVLTLTSLAVEQEIDK